MQFAGRLLHPQASLASLAALAAGALFATAGMAGSTGSVADPGRSPHGLAVHSTLSAASAPSPAAGHVTAASVAGPVVSVATTPTGNGWWDVTPTGDVYTFGDAGFHGSIGGAHLNQPIVGIASTPSGQGYWLVASDGGIFSFGDAAFHGSTGAIRLNQPIVGMTSTPSGQGYWLVATDGGIFSFGDAAFHGSTGAIRLNQPIVGMAATPTGAGYWMVASDGGLFNFGDAGFDGSAGGMALPAPVVGMDRSQDGHGYWLVLGNGVVLPYGDVPSIPTGGGVLPAPVAGASALPNGQGVRLIGVDGSSVALSPGSSAVATVAPSGNSNAFSYLVSNADGTPARFDPCSSIHYVTNLAAAPAGAAALVDGALARISAATGVSFVNNGSTTEIPSSQRPSVQSQYGPGWAPVIIAWAHAGQSDLLPGGNTIGEGGSSWVSVGGPKIYVTGEVVVDADRTAGLPATFGSGATLGELLLHELGHVIGLGHTSDANQIMYPTLVPVPSATYGAGDLTGLARVGRSAGCLSTPAP